MNNTFLKSTILLLVAVLCFSCTKDSEGDHSDFQSRIVLNSIFMPGEIMTVELSSSRDIFDSNSKIVAIQNAIVEVTDNKLKQTHRLYTQSNGVYQSENFRPIYGGSYTITVDAEGYESVRATSEIPYPAFIKEPTVEQGQINEQERRELFIDLEFYSESEEEQFYVWEIINTDEEANLDFSYNDVQENPVLLYSEDNNTESILADESFQTRVFLTDEGVNDSPIQTSFVTTIDPVAAFQFGDDFEEDPNAGVVLTVRVMTVSKDLYEYFKSVEVYRLRGTINSSITQPVSIHSNIEGGLGIFAGLTVKDLPIRLN